MASQPLPIDVEALVDATTSRDEAVLGSYLDLRTGAVFQLMDPALSGVDNEPIETAMDQEPARFARVPLFDREYRLMCAFVDEVEGESLACALDQALRGARAFQGFHECLAAHEEVGRQWEAFRRDALGRWVGAWLASLGVSVGRAGEPSPRRIDVHHLLAFGGSGVDEDGVVRRGVSLSTPQEARRLFKRFAQQVCEYRGEPWRWRQVFDGDAFEREDLRLRVIGSRVELEIHPDEALLRAFGLFDEARRGR